MRRRVRAGVVTLMAAVLWLLGGCAAAAQPLTESRVALDTVVTLTLYDTTDRALLTDCFDEIARYEALFSRTRADSEIAALNAADGAEVALSADTRDLLAIGRDYGARTDGALDITIGPVSALWDFEAETVPDAAALSDAAARVNWRALELTDTGARLPAGMAVDLGGIAKGYIADRLAERLRAAGVDSALLDLGGNIYALGKKDGRPFAVGIRDPQDANALAAVVRVSDRSVVTSGVYERGFERDGVTYHHLLDPATGWPVQNGLSSVTIVSDRSVDGDALSTACFVRGLADGLALVEATDGVEALFIETDGTLHASSGLEFEKR